MPRVVQFTAPRCIDVVDEPRIDLSPGEVRIETWYSGVSAGTELTAYRGSNPYLNKAWDAQRRLYVDGEPALPYPLTGWGYEEVGRVAEAAPDVLSPAVGELVYGIWGHRGEAVLPATVVAGHVLPLTVDPLHGVFARVGGIALNAVLAADIHLGEHVGVFGQGVIGLLATRLAALSGGVVAAVDAVPERLELAYQFGAADVVLADVPGGAGAALHDIAAGMGVDKAIEISGSYRGLHEAIRAVRPGGRVVAAGFYQGDGVGLRLGEEFHHNRVEVVASQISGPPRALMETWDHERLLRVFMSHVADGYVDVSSLVTHVLDVEDAASAFVLLDKTPQDALQVVLRFPAARDVPPRPAPCAERVIRGGRDGRPREGTRRISS